MKLFVGVFIAIFCGVAGARAQNTEMTIVFEEPMGGVYLQEWFALELGDFGGGSVDVYVRGEGKMGGFAGVLGVNCDHPEFSKWKATGGYLTQDRVPVPAINAIRTMVCS